MVFAPVATTPLLCSPSAQSAPQGCFDSKVVDETPGVLDLTDLTRASVLLGVMRPWLHDAEEPLSVMGGASLEPVRSNARGDTAPLAPRFSLG